MSQSSRAKCEQLVRRHYSDRGWRHVCHAYEALVREHVRPGTTVIDIGCGRDFPAAAWLSGLGAEVHGLDLEGPASSAPPGVQVRAGSVYEMPYGDATFDMAICSHVLEHLQHPRKAMAEIGRVLKPGGRFIFLTPSAWDYVSIAAR